MELVFTHASQSQADAFRARIEGAVEKSLVSMNTWSTGKLQPFAIESAARVAATGEGDIGSRSSKSKDWVFETRLRVSEKVVNETNDHSVESVWAELFERLLDRPNVKRGTIVTVGRFEFDMNDMTPRAEMVSVVRDRLGKAIKRYGIILGDGGLVRDLDLVNVATFLDCEGGRLYVVVQADATEAPLISQALKNAIGDYDSEPRPIPAPAPMVLEKRAD